jgi:hypothetical protein
MGFHPISVIGKGMQVYCYSPEGKLVLGDVTHSEKTEQYLYDSLKVNNEEIFADPEQYFFCPKRNNWIKLIELDIEKDSVLSHMQGAIPIENRHRITTILRNIKVPMYKISVQDYQNFLVTKQCLLVHNYTSPAVSLSAILINSIIDLGANLAVSYISDIISNELASRLKNACARLLPINSPTETTNNGDKITPCFKITHCNEVPNPNKNKSFFTLQLARNTLINKFNAVTSSKKNGILIAKEPLQKTIVNKLVKELTGPNSQQSADGSYWFSIEKLGNGATLTRRNHLPTKVDQTAAGKEAAHFEIHYTDSTMPEKTTTVVSIQVPVKD